MSDPTNIILVGACTVGGIAASLQVFFPTARITVIPFHDYLADGGYEKLKSLLTTAEYFIYLDVPVLERHVGTDITRERSVSFPEFVFPAFHPDLVYSTLTGGGYVFSAIQNCNSAIALWAYLNKKNVDETATLFRPEIFEALGYLDTWSQSAGGLKTRMEKCDLNFRALFFRLKRRLPFMYTFNHPRSFAIVELVRQMLPKLGYQKDIYELPVEDYVTDGLAGVVWPIYPGIAERMGFNGSLLWRNGLEVLDLKEFLGRSFAVYETYERNDIVCEALGQPIYDVVLGGAND